MTGQQRDLDAPAQAAATTGVRSLGRGGDIALRQVERDADLKPVVAHGAHCGSPGAVIKQLPPEAAAWALFRHGQLRTPQYF